MNPQNNTTHQSKFKLIL